MTTDHTRTTRISRRRVARTRGALSGVLLLLLGAWAGLVAFIGPYFDFAYTPAPDTAWHWTSARGWLEVLPGAATVLGGLLLIISASRITTSLGSWLGVAGGGWLVVGPPLASFLDIDLGTPDPRSSNGVQALEALFYFFAVGAAIVFVAAVALGRLSVRSLRDIRAAERAAERSAAAERSDAVERSAAVDERAPAPPAAVDERAPAPPAAVDERPGVLAPDRTVDERSAPVDERSAPSDPGGRDPVDEGPAGGAHQRPQGS